MNLPRFSIAGIMTMIVVVAFDFAAIRALDRTGTLVRGLIAVGSIPMAGILMLGIPSLIKGFSGRANDRCALRQKDALPLLNLFDEWLTEQGRKALPKSPIGQAIAVARSNWAALLWYIHGAPGVEHR
jgi:hypothetical protein